MLTKSQMESIWNSREIGKLRRDFCFRGRKKALLKFTVSYKVEVSKIFDSDATDTVFARNRNEAISNEEVRLRIKQLREKFAQEYPFDPINVHTSVASVGLK